MNTLPIEYIRETWDYDPVNGGLLWKKGQGPSSPARIGAQAGSECRPGGYVVVKTKRKCHCIHRLVWAWHHGAYPEGQIDHINLVRGDNRIENLRCASQSQNMANKSRKKEYASPYKGVYKRWGRNGRWGACIGHNKKRIYLGYFSTPEEAQAAYLEAATRLFGEFARAA